MLVDGSIITATTLNSILTDLEMQTLSDENFPDEAFGIDYVPSPIAFDLGSDIHEPGVLTLFTDTSFDTTDASTGVIDTGTPLVKTFAGLDLSQVQGCLVQANVELYNFSYSGGLSFHSTTRSITFCLQLQVKIFGNTTWTNLPSTFRPCGMAVSNDTNDTLCGIDVPLWYMLTDDIIPGNEKRIVGIRVVGRIDVDSSDYGGADASTVADLEVRLRAASLITTVLR